MNGDNYHKPREKHWFVSCSRKGTLVCLRTGDQYCCSTLTTRYWQQDVASYDRTYCHRNRTVLWQAGNWRMEGWCVRWSLTIWSSIMTVHTWSCLIKKRHLTEWILLIYWMYSGHTKSLNTWSTGWVSSTHSYPPNCVLMDRWQKAYLLKWGVRQGYGHEYTNTFNALSDDDHQSAWKWIER